MNEEYAHQEEALVRAVLSGTAVEDADPGGDAAVDYGVLLASETAPSTPVGARFTVTTDTASSSTNHPVVPSAAEVLIATAYVDPQATGVELEVRSLDGTVRRREAELPLTADSVAELVGDKVRLFPGDAPLVGDDWGEQGRRALEVTASVAAANELLHDGRITTPQLRDLILSQLGDCDLDTRRGVVELFGRLPTDDGAHPLDLQVGDGHWEGFQLTAEGPRGKRVRAFTHLPSAPAAAQLLASWAEPGETVWVRHQTASWAYTTGFTWAEEPGQVRTLLRAATRAEEARQLASGDTAHRWRVRAATLGPLRGTLSKLDSDQRRLLPRLRVGGVRRGLGATLRLGRREVLFTLARRRR